MHLVIRTDGGSRGNPGPAGAAAVIRNEKGRAVFSGGFYLGRTTNNVAEYEGVLRALAEAERLGGTELEIFSDSELLVRQINGEYRVKNARLRSLYQQVMKRLEKFKKTMIRYVPRRENTEADALVNAVLDGEVEPREGAERLMRRQLSSENE